MSGAAPALFELDGPEEEMDALAGNFRALEQQGIALKSQAVLARSNGALARVAEALEARGVPVLYLGPLFERPEIRDLLSLLSLLVDAKIGRAHVELQSLMRTSYAVFCLTKK